MAFNRILHLAKTPVGGGGSGTVVFDAKSTAVSLGTGVFTHTHNNMTVGTGANRVLVCTIAFSAASGTGGLGVTWDGQTMTQMTAGFDSVSGLVVTIHALLNPNSGNKALIATWTGGTEQVYVACVSFTGVNQGGGTTSFPNVANTASTGVDATPSVTVTTASGNVVVAVFETTAGSWGTITGTTIYADPSLSNNGAAAYDPSTTTSKTMTAAAGGPVAYCAAALDIKAA